MRSILRRGKYCFGLFEGSRGSRGTSKIDDGQFIPRQQEIECKGTIERLVPGPDATGKHSAHRQGAGKTLGEQLNQASRDDSAQRVTPGYRASRLTTVCVEVIQQGNLIVECLFERPASLAVRRASQRIALLQERSASQRVTDILGRVE